MNDKRIDAMFDKQIADTVERLMKSPTISALDKDVKEQMRQDLTARARDIVKRDGHTGGLAEFGKMYG